MYIQIPIDTSTACVLHIHIHVCVYIYIYVNIHTHTHIHTYIHTYIYIHLPMLKGRSKRKIRNRHICVQISTTRSQVYHFPCLHVLILDINTFVCTYMHTCIYRKSTGSLLTILVITTTRGKRSHWDCLGIYPYGSQIHTAARPC